MALQMGNVKPSIQDRSVYRPLGGQNYHGNTCACPIRVVQGWTLAAERTVYGLLHELTACGIKASGIVLNVLLPTETEEPALKKLMQEIGSLAKAEGITVDYAQVTASSHVDTLVIQAAVNGNAAMDKISFPNKKEKALLDLVVVGTVGCEGAAILFREHKKELLSRYTEQFLARGDLLYPEGSLQKILPALDSCGLHYARAGGEGGIFAALWELAVSLKTGMEVYLKQIPIRQHTIEICEFFALNPYLLMSGGALLVACEEGESLVSQLIEWKLPAAVIGHTSRNQDKIIYYDDERRYLEPSKMDEYYKVNQ